MFLLGEQSTPIDLLKVAPFKKGSLIFIVVLDYTLLFCSVSIDKLLVSSIYALGVNRLEAFGFITLSRLNTVLSVCLRRKTDKEKRRENLPQLYF